MNGSQCKVCVCVCLCVYLCVQQRSPAQLTHKTSNALKKEKHLLKFIDFTAALLFVGELQLTSIFYCEVCECVCTGLCSLSSMNTSIMRQNVICEVLVIKCELWIC